MRKNTSTLHEATLHGKTVWVVRNTLWEGHIGNPIVEMPQDYADGKPSYAHLHTDGQIARFHKRIGHRRDLHYTGKKVEVEFTEDGKRNLEAWGRRNPAEVVKMMVGAVRFLSQQQQGGVYGTTEEEGWH